MGLAELQVVHVTPSVYQKVATKPEVIPVGTSSGGSPGVSVLNRDYLHHEERDTTVVEEDNSQCSLLTVSDYGWSMFVIMPLVVGQWRGSWELMNVLIPPNQYQRGLWWSMWVGFGVGILFALLRKPLSRLAMPKHPRGLPARVAFYVFSRVLIALFAVACIAQWRGFWDLITLYCGSTYQLSLFSIGLGGATLVRLKALRNLSGPPFNLAFDLRETIFSFPTRYRTSGAKDPILHFLDCVFSVMVVGSLVVIVWRGTWGILDHVLLPHNSVASAWVSLGIGYGVTALGFALQVPARIACDRLSGALRLIVADAYQFFCFCGTVNLWRGVWNLLNEYLLPENPLASYWLTHWACLLLLIALGCSNSLLVRGILIDGEEEGGQCVVFQCNYLRHRFQVKRRRQAQQAATVQAATVNLLEKRKPGDVTETQQTPNTARSTTGRGGTLDNNIHHVSMMTRMRDTLL